MVHHVSRDHYKVACDFILRMIKIGGREEANILIKNLRTLYPQRRALMEELSVRIEKRHLKQAEASEILMVRAPAYPT